MFTTSNSTQTNPKGTIPAVKALNEQMPVNNQATVTIPKNPTYAQLMAFTPAQNDMLFDDVLMLHANTDEDCAEYKQLMALTDPEDRDNWAIEHKQRRIARYATRVLAWEQMRERDQAAASARLETVPSKLIPANPTYDQLMDLTQSEEDTLYEQVIKFDAETRRYVAPMLQELYDLYVPSERASYTETIKQRSIQRYIERKLFEKTQAEDRLQFERECHSAWKIHEKQVKQLEEMHADREHTQHALFEKRQAQEVLDFERMP